MATDRDSVVGHEFEVTILNVGSLAGFGAVESVGARGKERIGCGAGRPGAAFYGNGMVVVGAEIATQTFRNTKVRGIQNGQILQGHSGGRSHAYHVIPGATAKTNEVADGATAKRIGEHPESVRP